MKKITAIYIFLLIICMKDFLDSDWLREQCNFIEIQCHKRNIVPKVEIFGKRQNKRLFDLSFDFWKGNDIFLYHADAQLYKNSLYVVCVLNLQSVE